MTSSALTRFTARLHPIQLLWSESQKAADLHRKSVRRGARDPNAKQLAAEQQQIHSALVESAIVRLATSWEIFLAELFEEFLLRRSTHFRKHWALRGGQLSKGTVEQLVEANGRPFQDIERATKVLKTYLGADVFGPIKLDVVHDLIAVRNAIVHRGGRPTKKFKQRFGKEVRSAHRYLLSSPTKAAGIPATHFERIQTDVTVICSDLYVRAFRNPRVP